MIKAQELRIGNQVYLPTIEKNITVDYHHIRYATINPNNEYEPIPLTPEILERFGFDRNMGGWLLEGDINQKSFRSDDESKYGWSLEMTDVDDNDVHFRIGYSKILIKDAPARHIKYLHQLQNLYHALTGEELGIKENNKEVIMNEVSLLADGSYGAGYKIK